MAKKKGFLILKLYFNFFLSLFIKYIVSIIIAVIWIIFFRECYIKYYYFFSINIFALVVAGVKKSQS